jgi:predicted Zn-ribbon and HTH transcriptional regulator
MPRPKLEIADIFRAHGPAWRQTNAGHVSLSQLKVMSAIDACRTEALGGHVAGCVKCGHHHIAYNSCKNRHCPKCQGPAARDWMEAQRALWEGRLDRLDDYVMKLMQENGRDG